MVIRKYIDVGSGRLGMAFVYQDIRNPILLVCGGGPGIPEYLLEWLRPSVLSRFFNVCFLDWRGTGLSYCKSQDAKDMTRERYVSDIHEVTLYLKREYKREKIYLMGHSFGTFIAVEVSRKFPNDYYAYLSMSQIVDQAESEYRAYDYMIEAYSKQGDRKSALRLIDYNIKESVEAKERYFRSSLRDRSMHRLGIGTMRDMHSVINGLFLPSFRCGFYSLGERFAIWRAKFFSDKFPVVRDALEFDAFGAGAIFEIPVFCIVGQYDYTCNHDLQKEYFGKLSAPIKRLYVFPDAAHSPIFENTEKAGTVLKEIISLSSK